MSLLAIAYPQLESKDFDWIQSIRAQHDPRYFRVIEPHFTLVFPVFETDQKLFINHVEGIAKKFKEFYFVLRCAQIVKDSFSDYTDVFLIPEEGYRIFVKLHDQLYTGLLQKELRMDIPFIPHIGVAGSLNPLECKKIADEINAAGPEIFGTVNRLDIVDYDDGKVKTIKELLLK